MSAEDEMTEVFEKADDFDLNEALDRHFAEFFNTRERMQREFIHYELRTECRRIANKINIFDIPEDFEPDSLYDSFVQGFVSAGELFVHCQFAALLNVSSEAIMWAIVELSDMIPRDATFEERAALVIQAVKDAQIAQTREAGETS